jgi:hypothetical protein
MIITGCKTLAVELGIGELTVDLIVKTIKSIVSSPIPNSTANVLQPVIIM